MQIISVNETGQNFQYKWPDSSIENYPNWISYKTRSNDGLHNVIIGFGIRNVYGRDRVRVVIVVDNYTQAEFLGADDFEYSGEVLSDIKVKGKVGEKICRYPDNPVPERYTIFNVVGLPNRVSGKGVHKAWAVVASIADHKTLISLAALRMEERRRAT